MKNYSEDLNRQYHIQVQRVKWEDSNYAGRP